MTPGDLLNKARDLAVSISQAAKRQQSIGSKLDEIEDCAFIGNKDGKLISTNTTFDRVFGNGIATAGRDQRLFLHPGALSLWDATHQMFRVGCEFVLAEHALKQDDAEEVLLRCCTAIYFVHDASCPDQQQSVPP